MTAPRHLRIITSAPADRAAALEGLELPPLLAAVSAHRRLRGPYTAVGTLLRSIVPDALERCPEAVARHTIEILSTTPELRALVPATRETLTSLAVPRERTRFYSKVRTLRMANGLVDFLNVYLRALGDQPRALVVHDVHHADPTDAEFLAVLLRRINPERLMVVVTTADGPLQDPADAPAETLGAAVAAYCAQVDAPASDASGEPGGPALAARYIEGDGTSDDPAQYAAYLRLPPADRQARHDLRRQALEAAGEPSLRLGAVAWHAENGSDPAGAGADVLRHALDLCMDLGFYHAVLDYGARGRRLVTYDSNPDHWWAFSTKMTTSLAALGLAEEALELYDEARELSTSPSVHMQAAYATAMIYTRHLAEENRDHAQARRWINQGIAFAGQLPEPKDRAMRTAFYRNGLALIEMHRGNREDALALVDTCLADLDAVLDPDEQALHRSVLRHNRAQLLNALGRTDEAFADFSAVIACDPNYAEYYLDRGMLLHRQGRLDEALADYDKAIELSPPFPEVYYNRAEARRDSGDLAGALADYAYVLDLNPFMTDAHINRSAVLVELAQDDPEAVGLARAGVEAGLTVAVHSPELLCLKGQLHELEGEAEEAAAAYSATLAAAADYAEAWALRGGLAHQAGDLASAIADLEQACALSDEPGFRFNLAVAYQEDARHDLAVKLLDSVVAETDDLDARVQRARSLIALGRAEDAADDLRTCAEADPSHLPRLRELAPDLSWA
ncbi:tetratricopeptide repeat protein [Streptacidiphilus rugosus]|uniref:tetratricopeptide repeat protein n=1 Tax=Streptacidiphilus rugosus TaxID=405783 RepID=UPI00068CAD61|nr:tetratricopeptide repeat protein [Streptacidiphilus rugosus]